MLQTFVDRIFSWAVLYAIFIYGSWQARAYTTDIVSSVVFLLSTAWYARIVLYHIIQEYTISSHGKHAHVVRTYTPLNLGFLFQTLHYFSEHRNHDLWWKMFRSVMRTSKRPYTVETVVIGQRILFTADEENIKAILATQFDDYGKGEQFRTKWKEFLGLSIFTTDGHQWHDSRQLLRPQFVKDRVSDLQTFERHIQVLLPMLVRSSGSGSETVKLDDLFYRFTLDAATDFLFADSAGSLVDEKAEFATAFAEAQRVQATIARAGPLSTFIPMKTFRQALGVLNRFMDRYIEEALRLPLKELETKSHEGHTFLHAIATYTSDRRVLRDQLIAVLLAGRDTTAVTLSWLFYELSNHPRMVQKLRLEIADRVDFHNAPTYEDLKAMRYLQHTLNEVLRLYPAVPYNVRVALQDTMLPRGGGPYGEDPIGIAKDTPIAYSPYIMHRRPDIYPSTDFADPLIFAPERWEGWTPRPWTYLPFNGGPRICIGQQFALAEMAYTVTRILQKFERVECKMDGHPGTKTDIVIQPARGVYVKFVEAGV